MHRKLADVFYSRFFELAPDARALFPQDFARQHLKFMDMIAAIVGALDKREIFQSIISYSGREHARFGVKRSHFVAFGDALIWGLEHQFGAAFTPELKQAWLFRRRDRGSTHRKIIECNGAALAFRAQQMTMNETRISPTATFHSSQNDRGLSKSKPVCSSRLK